MKTVFELRLQRAFVLVLFLTFFEPGDSDDNLMVAFLCNRPTMHLTEDGWTKDDQTGCLRHLNDILEYCRKVYPSADVERAEESEEKVTIENWCRSGQVRCHDRFEVAPFRCLRRRNVQENGPEDDFSNYIYKPSNDLKWKEHESYVKAKKDLSKYHHNKVSKMMKDWAEARRRVESLKSVDLKSSEKLSKDITTRFQKMYEAEEEESDLENKQLEQLHQRRLEMHLVEQRQKAFDDFLASTDDQDAPISKVVKHLRHLIKVLQKERSHLTKAYSHLKETDAAAAERRRNETVLRLQDVDELLEKTLWNLEQSKHKKKIRLLIDDDLENYHELDDTISSLLQLQEFTSTTISPTSTSTKTSVEKDDDDGDDDDDDYVYDDDEDDDYDETIVSVNSVSKAATDVKTDEGGDDDDDDDDDEDDDYYDGEDESENIDNKYDENAEATSVFPSPSVPSLVDSRPSFPGLSSSKIADDFVYDDYIRMENDNRASNFGQSNLHAKETSFPKSSAEQTGKFGSALPLGIAVGSIAIFVIIIVGVVATRRHSRRRRPSLLKMTDPVPSATPEERHVANMQMNGYENPTYKYFDVNSK